MPASNSPLPVLVVDDSPVARKIVEQSLPKDEYALLSASTGHQAESIFAEHHPPIVITDWLMPDISGVELCQKIRAENTGHHTHVILVTGVTEKDRIVGALEAGADDYVTKPFHPGELLARVRVGRRLVEQSQEIETKNRMLERLALTDELTSLPNRRAIEEWASRQLSAATRYEFSIWGIMADLDRFKSINDTYGHAAGDSVIRRFAETIVGSMRHCDAAGRIGGEEFLLVITHVDRAGVQIAVERIRERFSRQRFVFDGKEVTATASFGVAAAPPGESLDFAELVSRADRALYAAKNLGRNRVEFDETEVSKTAG